MAHIGIYGGIQIKRGFCKKCNGYAFVIDGKLQCCDEKHDDQAQKYKVISEPCGKRREPGNKIKQKILILQNDKCFYCNKPFGTMYERNGKINFTKLRWDHKVPFSYTQNNETDNWAAACNICNGIKSNKMFSTIEEVIEYVEERRKKKGYVFYEDTEKKVL